MNRPSSNDFVPRILVADDSDTIQKVVRIALARQAVKIEVASSWLDASSKIGTGVALLLLDVNLPGVGSDPAKLKEVVAAAGKVPILVMQGSHDRSLTEAALLECGISQVIQKPFDSNELIGIVSNLAGLSRVASTVGISSPAAASPQPPPPPSSSSLDLFSVDMPGSSSEKPSDFGSLPPLPSDLIDAARKGKKAFDLAPENLFNLSPPPQGHQGHQGHGFTPSGASPPPPPAPSFQSPPPSPLLGDDMAKQVRQAVESYCDRHFRSLAIEVITAELRRLAEEKARHLVDI